MKNLNEKAVFQYDVKKKSVSEVDEQIWHNATEKTSVCQSWIGNEPDYDKTFRTRGKYFLTANYSPDKTKIATLSAIGPKLPNFSLIPFSGDGRILGARYLEIKDPSNNYQSVGAQFRLKDENLRKICWSADESLVVVYNLSEQFFYFSVADLNPRAAQTAAAAPPRKNQKPKPDLSRVTRVVGDYGIDENGDGLFEKIAVEVETETSVAGIYRISLLLQPETGKGYIENAAAELKEGLQTVKVLFDTKDFVENKAEGTFDVQLFAFSYDFINVERNKKIGQTQEYKLSQYQRPNVVFTGENAVTPVDKNSSGKYEGLEIKVGTDVLEAGDYEFQGDLYDEFSDVTSEGSIDSFYGKANLKKGKSTITFFFGGAKIIEHGKSGRFRLRYVVVHKVGASAPYVENLLETLPFDVSRFETEN